MCEAEIMNVMTKPWCEFDVAEIFSRPRVVKFTAKYKLNGGYSLDKLCVDGVTGKRWDFLRGQDVTQFNKLRCERKTLVLIASPLCTKFSNWVKL